MKKVFGIFFLCAVCALSAQAWHPHRCWYPRCYYGPHYVRPVFYTVPAYYPAYYPTVYAPTYPVWYQTPVVYPAPYYYY